MVEVGSFSLLVAVFICGYASLAALIAARSGRSVLMRSAENATFAVCGLLTIAVAALIYAFVTHDFRLAYVANYSNQNLPLTYTISALWGGQAGSLLFWVWLLAIFAVIAVLQNRRRNRALMPYVIAVVMAVELFLVILTAFITSPFESLGFMPRDGQGLNPLLQNPGMLIHPPMLFLGYVGFTIPFAFALAALATGELGDVWIRTTRRWTILSWLFLGIGIYLGARWAYVELGWGGYWAWDPVENASLMPWLTGTAYLHSVMIQERKNMLKVWNMVLVVLTFLLCIFGTFITRSGIISSVHAFGQSSLGPFFVVFIVVILIGSLVLLIVRLPKLKSPKELDSLISRESSFLFNNLLLVGAAFTVFLGTMFPVISEAVQGVRMTVGPPFFNKLTVPIGLLLLLLTGICPMIAWRKATGRNLGRNLIVPSIAATVGAVVFLIAGIRNVYALLAFALSIFVVCTIIIEFIRGVQARKSMKAENFLVALGQLVWRNKRRYGGYLVHAGMVLIFLGIAGSSAFKAEKEVNLARGESTELRDYRVVYENFVQYPTANKQVTSAVLTVYRAGNYAGTLSPAVELYEQASAQRTTEVAIKSNLKEDLYVILAGYDVAQQTITLKLVVSPLVAWIWIGGLMIALGTLWALLPGPTARKKKAAGIGQEGLPA